MAGRLVDIPVTYEHETGKAYLVTPDGRTDGLWVSKQYCEIDPDKGLVRGQSATITVESWFAKKIGLV